MFLLLCLMLVVHLLKILEFVFISYFNSYKYIIKKVRIIYLWLSFKVSKCLDIFTLFSHSREMSCWVKDWCITGKWLFYRKRKVNAVYHSNFHVYAKVGVIIIVYTSMIFTITNMSDFFGVTSVLIMSYLSSVDISVQWRKINKTRL